MYSTSIHIIEHSWEITNEILNEQNVWVPVHNDRNNCLCTKQQVKEIQYVCVKLTKIPFPIKI